MSSKPKLDGQRNVKRGTSANSAHQKESQITPWAHAVAMLTAKGQPAAQASNQRLPEDFSASDFDIIRARGLSSQI